MEVDDDMERPSTSFTHSQSGDVNIDAMATSAMPSTGATGAHKSIHAPFRKSVGYTEMLTEILVGVREEIDSTALTQLQIICQRLRMSADQKTELISKNRLVEVFHVLMKHTNNDLRQIVQILNEFLPKIIRNLPLELVAKMGWLSETIAKENEHFGLTGTSVLHGRGDDLQRLEDLMNSEKQKDALLVNVCGMAGIGKSHLIKHLCSRLLYEGHSVVIYVDASGVTKISDVVARICEKYKIEGCTSGETSDLTLSLLDWLKQNMESKFVLVIDDVSTLISESDVKQTNELLSFFNGVVRQAKKSKIKLKILVTSQTHFKSINEKTEMKELVEIKRKMSSYTRDHVLSTLTNDDALKFLGPCESELTRNERDRLIELCKGHPYSLHIMSAMADLGFSYSTEMSKLSPKHVDALNAELADMMFENTYQRLTETQKIVLLTVALFDGDAQLNVLHYIINFKGTKDQFCTKVKQELCNGFWLTFRVCDIKSESSRKTVVNVHHSLIMRFLRKKITEYLDDKDSAEYALFIRLKERYVSYYLTELVEIGKSCVPETAPKSDFVQRACARFMYLRPNFRIALQFIVHLENPYLLFSKGPNSNDLRDPCDIIHLFLCFHQYHDCFDGFLIRMVQKLVDWKINDSIHKVLLWTLYVMMLTLQQDWITLAAVLDRHVDGADPKLICSLSPDLYSFCKALYGYAAGSRYTFASAFRDSKELNLTQKRHDVLDRALNNLKLKILSPNWIAVRKYFSIRILLVQAEATFLTNQRDVATIKRAYALCKRAKEYTPDVLILEPEVYAELATYRANEGDQYDDVKKASELYMEARYFHEKVVEKFKSRRMDRTAIAARNLKNYAMLMRSWGNLILQECERSQFGEATAKLNEAKVLGSQVIQMLECTPVCSPSVRPLYEAYEFQGTCYFYSIEYNHRYKKDQNDRINFQREALRYYNKAYNLLKRDYRTCHISANDSTINHLSDWYPKMMKSHGLDHESVDKVKANLRTIREEVGKQGSAKLDLSGSDQYSSTEDESSDDDMVDSTGKLTLDSPVESMGVECTDTKPPETLPEQCVSGDEELDGASSSKRFKR